MKLRNNNKGDLILGGWPVLGKDGRMDYCTPTIHMPSGQFVEVSEECFTRHRLQARLDSGELSDGAFACFQKDTDPVHARAQAPEPTQADADALFLAQLEALEASASKKA